MTRASDDRGVPRELILVLVAAPVIVGLAIVLFTWPAARAQPRDVPLAVAATGPAGDTLAGRLDAAQGMFVVHRYPDASAARHALTHREVDAAVVSFGGHPQVLIASAAGPALSTAVRPTLVKLVRGAKVTDVVPTPTADPTGTVIGSAVLPLTLAGEISAFLLAFSVRPGARQGIALVVISSAIGLIGVAIVQEWLGALDGGTWWVEAAVLALTVQAIGSIVAGLHALVGRFGLPIALALLVFAGNAFSGAMSAPQLLPEGVRRIGQWLPPGAGNELLRSVSFFHGYGWVHPFVVLVVWIALGSAALVVGAVLADRRVRAQGRHERPDATSAFAPVSG